MQATAVPCVVTLLQKALHVMQTQLVADTAGMVLDRLEEVHSALTRSLWQHRRNSNRQQVMMGAGSAVQAMLQRPPAEL